MWYWSRTGHENCHRASGCPSRGAVTMISVTYSQLSTVGTARCRYHPADAVTRRENWRQISSCLHRGDFKSPCFADRGESWRRGRPSALSCLPLSSGIRVQRFVDFGRCVRFTSNSSARGSSTKAPPAKPILQRMTAAITKPVRKRTIWQVVWRHQCHVSRCCKATPGMLITQLLTAAPYQLTRGLTRPETASLRAAQFVITAGVQQSEGEIFSGCRKLGCHTLWIPGSDWRCSAVSLTRCHGQRRAASSSRGDTGYPPLQQAVASIFYAAFPSTSQYCQNALAACVLNVDFLAA